MEPSLSLSEMMSMYINIPLFSSQCWLNIRLSPPSTIQHWYPDFPDMNLRTLNYPQVVKYPRRGPKYVVFQLSCNVPFIPLSWVSGESHYSYFWAFTQHFTFTHLHTMNVERTTASFPWIWGQQPTNNGMELKKSLHMGIIRIHTRSNGNGS
jgi:hypothetical protein